MEDVTDKNLEENNHQNDNISNEVEKEIISKVETIDKSSNKCIIQDICETGEFTISTSKDKVPARIKFFKNYLSEDEANDLYESLVKELDWQQKNSVNNYGKEYPEPRMTYWFGKSYKYSSVSWEANQEWHPKIAQLRDALCSDNNFPADPDKPLNSVMCNYYRDNKDSIGWHSDDEVTLGRCPAIASISLGCTRVFEVAKRAEYYSRFQKPVTDSSTFPGCTTLYRFHLGNGSLLVMYGSVQDDWLHQVPKVDDPMDGRINLTFRHIVNEEEEKAEIERKKALAKERRKYNNDNRPVDNRRHDRFEERDRARYEMECYRRMEYQYQRNMEKYHRDFERYHHAYWREYQLGSYYEYCEDQYEEGSDPRSGEHHNGYHSDYNKSDDNRHRKPYNRYNDNRRKGENDSDDMHHEKGKYNNRNGSSDTNRGWRAEGSRSNDHHNDPNIENSFNQMEIDDKRQRNRNDRNYGGPNSNYNQTDSAGKEGNEHHRQARDENSDNWRGSGANNGAQTRGDWSRGGDCESGQGRGGRGTRGQNRPYGDRGSRGHGNGAGRDEDDSSRHEREANAGWRQQGGRPDASNQHSSGGGWSRGRPIGPRHEHSDRDPLSWEEDKERHQRNNYGRQNVTDSNYRSNEPRRDHVDEDEWRQYRGDGNRRLGDDDDQQRHRQTNGSQSNRGYGGAESRGPRFNNTDNAGGTHRGDDDRVSNDYRRGGRGGDRGSRGSRGNVPFKRHQDQSSDGNGGRARHPGANNQHDNRDEVEFVDSGARLFSYGHGGGDQCAQADHGRYQSARQDGHNE